MSWIIKTDSNRVQWTSKEFRAREDLADYLKYFAIDNIYKGPASYISPVDSSVVSITYFE